MLAGYNIPLTNTAALTTSLANASATEVPRALAAIDLAGGFALTGVTTNQFGGNNMRSGASDGFGNYWGVGANSGTYYFGDGPAASVQNVVSNSAVIEDLGGDLYFSTSKTIPGIWKIQVTIWPGNARRIFERRGEGQPICLCVQPGYEDCVFGG